MWENINVFRDLKAVHGTFLPAMEFVTAFCRDEAKSASFSQYRYSEPVFWPTI
jgi:hypothetical protein